MEAFQNNCFYDMIWFRYDLLLWFVGGLVLQLWFWYGFSSGSKLWFWCGSKVWFVCVCFFVGGCFDFFKHVLNTYQNHINIIWKFEKSTKSVSGLFPFLISNPSHRELWKRRSVPTPYQNHIKFISKTISKSWPKSYPIHNKTMSKS